MTITKHQHRRRRLSPRQRELVKAFEVEGYYHDEFRITGSNAENDDDHMFSFLQPEHAQDKLAVATCQERLDSFLRVVSNYDFNQTFYFTLFVGAAMMAGCFLWSWASRCNQQRRGATEDQTERKNNTGCVTKSKIQEQGNKSDDETLLSTTKGRALSCKDSASVQCTTPSRNPRTDAATNHPRSSNDDDDDSELPKQTISGDFLLSDEEQNGPPKKHMDSSRRDPIDNCIQQAVAPKLIDDKAIDSPIQKTKFNISNEQVSAPRQSVRDKKEEFRTEILANAAVYKQVLEEACQESGGMLASSDMIAALSLQAAIAKRQTDAQLQAEFRGYQFETYQRGIDRELDERRHLETVRSFREDKDWLRKIVQARDECVTALKVSLNRSFALLIGFRPMLTLLKIIRLWNYSVSCADLVVRVIAMVATCPSECSTSPPSPSIFHLEYWIQLMGAYGPSALTAYVGGSHCLIHNAVAALVFLVAFGATSLLARLFSLPAFSTSVVVAFAMSGQFSINHFQNGSLVLLFTGLSSYFSLMVYFSMCRGKLQRCCSPESATVSKVQDHFLCARDTIEMLPFAVLLWRLASAAVMSLNQSH